MARGREQIHRECVGLTTMTFLIPESKPATESTSIQGSQAVCSVANSQRPGKPSGYDLGPHLTAVVLSEGKSG